jgi:hypothetical protein
MLIPLFARVTGFKVENLWRRGSRGTVRCTARLSRRLRAEELERIARLETTSVDGTVVVHEGRADDLEEWHTKLLDALAGVAIPRERRAAVGERKARRVVRKGGRTDPPKPDPAA